MLTDETDLLSKGDKRQNSFARDDAQRALYVATNQPFVRLGSQVRQKLVADSPATAKFMQT